MRKVVFLLFFSVLSIETMSQSQVADSAEVRRDWLKLNYQPVLRLEQLLEGGSYWFAETSVYFPEEYAAVFNEQSRWYLWAGAEYKATEHWYMGASLKFNQAENYSTLIPRFNFSHKGKIGKLDFWKEASYEHILFEGKNISRKAEARVAGTIGLGSTFNIAQQKFYTSFSVKPYISFDFEKDDFSFYRNRSFDRLKMRWDLFYAPVDFMRVGFFLMKDTEFYYTLGGFSSTGGAIPDYKVNRISSILGLSIHFILNSEKDKTFLTGWPSR